MKITPGKRGLSAVLCLALVAVTTPMDAGTLMVLKDQEAAPASAPSSTSSTGYPGQGAPMSTQELESLVAPIALYPDALLAQILSAAIFPDQIAVANYWLQQNKNLTGSALGQAVNGQSWDPSVKALTQFPSVLKNLVGLRRLRLRRIKFVREQFYLAAVAQNLKRLVRFLTSRPQLVETSN